MHTAKEVTMRQRRGLDVLRAQLGAIDELRARLEAIEQRNTVAGE